MKKKWEAKSDQTESKSFQVDAVHTYVRTYIHTCIHTYICRFLIRRSTIKTEQFKHMAQNNMKNRRHKTKQILGDIVITRSKEMNAT